MSMPRIRERSEQLRAQVTRVLPGRGRTLRTGYSATKLGLLMDKAITVIRPKLVGLDEYMRDVRRLVDLLNEAAALYEQLSGAEITVDYEIEPTRTG